MPCTKSGAADAKERIESIINTQRALFLVFIVISRPRLVSCPFVSGRAKPQLPQRAHQAAGAFNPLHIINATQIIVKGGVFYSDTELGASEIKKTLIRRPYALNRCVIKWRRGNLRMTRIYAIRMDKRNIKGKEKG